MAALATAAIPGLQVTEVYEHQVQEPGRASTRIRDARGDAWTVTVTDEELDTDTLEMRRDLLRFLGSCTSSDVIPFSVPQIAAWLKNKDNTYTVLYSVTAGEPISRDGLTNEGLLSGSLARSLAALHNLEPRALETLGTRTHSIHEMRRGLRAEIRSIGRDLPGPLRKRWLCVIDEDVVWGFDPAPTHAHLSLDSILISHGAVRSITDCELLEVADPAVDLAWLLPLVSDDFLSPLVEAYSAARTQADLHLFTRAQFYSELALLDWLRFGLSQGNETVVSEAAQMLSDLNADLAGAMLVEPTRPVVQVHFEAADEPLNRIGRKANLDSEGTVAYVPDFGDSEHPDPVQQVEDTASPAEPTQDPKEALTEAFNAADTSIHSQVWEEDETDGETHSFEVPRR